jgi:hypothetical protein
VTLCTLWRTRRIPAFCLTLLHTSYPTGSRLLSTQYYHHLHIYTSLPVENMPKKPKDCTGKLYLVKRILDEGVRGKDKFFLVEWEPSLATIEEMNEFPYKTAEPKDGKFIVDWQPSWQPQARVRQDGLLRVKEWEAIKGQVKPWLRRSTLSHLSASSSTTSTSAPHVVSSDDSDSEGKLLKDAVLSVTIIYHACRIIH